MTAKKASEPVEYVVADNMELPRFDRPRDIFIEGWSWGHPIVGAPNSVGENAAALFASVGKNLVPRGAVVLIETLGTNVREPAAPHPRLSEFYELLSGEYGFEQKILRTDFRFESADAAIDACGFFFGDQMRRDLQADPKAIVPEYTGVWRGPV